MATVPEIKLVVFDWAGTLIDFGCCAPAGAFVQAFAARGVDVTIAEARAPMGLHKKQHIAEMLRVPGIAERWRATTGRGWTEADVEDLYRVVTPLQVESARLYSKLTPHVLGSVTFLRERGIRAATTTGYFQAAAAIVYEAAAEQGLRPDFRICADEVPTGRPAPWMIYRAMEAVNVYPPHSVLKIGDTLIDIAEGISAGTWSAGVIDSSNEMGLSEQDFADTSELEREGRRIEIRERFQNAGAHDAIRTLAELPKLIEGLNRRLAAGERPASPTSV